MARAESRTKMGFYVIDPKHHEAILSLVEPSANESARIIDPFAGEGDFLALAAERWKMTPYANELDEDRAAMCIDRFGSTRAVSGDALTLVASNEAFSVLWINPPYDTVIGEGDDSRVEFTMLRHSLKWAQLNAVVFWVIYQHHLTEKAAALFAKQFRQVDVWGLPGKHLGEYSQIIVAGIYGKNPDPEATYQDILRQRENPKLLTTQEKPLYKVPPVSEHQQFRFTTHLITPQQGLALSKSHGASHHASLFDTFHREVVDTKRPDPIVRPRPGHTALVLGAGITNGTVLHTETGKAAVRGKITVNTELARREVEGDPENPQDQHVKTTYRLRPSSTISLLGEDGTITILEGDEALLEFIGKNQEGLAKYMNNSFNPLYKFDWCTSTHTLKPYLDAIKVKGKHSLYTAQKHIIAAVCRGFESRKGILLNGQMGVGKTSIASSAIIAMTGNISRQMQEYLQPNQISLLVAPPHLIEKWERELRTMYQDIYVAHCKRHEEVKIFLDAIHDATRPLSKFILATFASSLDTRKLLELQLLIAAASVTPKIMLVKRDMAKLGSSTRPAIIWRKRYKTLWRKDEKVPDGYKSEDRIVRMLEPECPHCGMTVFMHVGKKKEPQIASQDWLKKTQRVCVNCRQPLFQTERLDWEKPKNGAKYAPCNPRFPIDEYLAAKYKDRVYLLIWDEVHEAQRADRGNGSAFGRLANIAKKILAMTGTPFNGKSSSLFNLEYHINPRVRKRYPWGGSPRLARKKRGSNGFQYIKVLDTDFADRGGSEARWVRDMGIMEKAIDEYPQYDSESGAYTGVATYERPYVEANGISPRLVAEMLDHTIFLSLQDLGANLPQYTELTIPVSMDSDVKSEYDKVEKDLKDYLKSRYWEGDTSFRGAYLQWSLGWPNRPFQATKVIHNMKMGINTKIKIPTTIAEIEAYDANRIFAKEQELITLLNDELAEDRPCVIYVRQTDTNDIQPRLEALLRKYVPKAKVFTLRSSVDPEKREKVIDQQIEKGINVLITNPILVATGLDLIQFKTLIWYEPIYDLRVMSQASSRTLRANADPKIPLRTFYMFYLGTMEHRAIQLMSRKQRAAKLLTGEVGLTGLDSLTEDESNFEESLVNTMLNGKQQLVDPRELFKKEDQLDAITQADLAFWNKPEEASEAFTLYSPWDIVREYFKTKGILNPNYLGAIFEKNQVTPVRNEQATAPQLAAAMPERSQSTYQAGQAQVGMTASLQQAKVNAKTMPNDSKLPTLPMFSDTGNGNLAPTMLEAISGPKEQQVKSAVKTEAGAKRGKIGPVKAASSNKATSTAKESEAPKRPEPQQIGNLRRLGKLEPQNEPLFGEKEKAAIAAISSKPKAKVMTSKPVSEDKPLTLANLKEWLERNEEIITTLPQENIFANIAVWKTRKEEHLEKRYLAWQERMTASINLLKQKPIFRKDTKAQAATEEISKAPVLEWQERMAASINMLPEKGFYTSPLSQAPELAKSNSRITDHIRTKLDDANAFAINLSQHAARLTTLICNGVPDPEDASIRIASGINDPYFNTSTTASKKLKSAVKQYLKKHRIIIDNEHATTLAGELITTAIKARDLFQSGDKITHLTLRSQKEKRRA